MNKFLIPASFLWNMNARVPVLAMAACLAITSSLYGADKGRAPISPAVASNTEPRVDSFAPLRRVLLRANVPFDPDVLLKSDWRDRLATAIGCMPEMSMSVAVSGKIDGGGIIAGVVTVTGDLEFSQDTVILAKRVIFNSATPLILAPGKAVGFFPVDSIEHTDTSIPRHTFRGFEINTDGRRTIPSLGSRRRPLSDGNTGPKGADGPTGPVGPDGGALAPAPDGSCGGNPDGADGIRGADGGPGGRGGNGVRGGDGEPAGPVTATIPPCSSGAFFFSARGGAGGIGGSGGTGGRGGDGGQGQRGGNGAACCPTKLGGGGTGGNGGNSASGGSGGNAESGGNGGPGAAITIVNHSYSATITSPANGGPGGQPGQPGQIGANGTPGGPGVGGVKAAGSGCLQGSDGNSGSYGSLVMFGNEPGSGANQGSTGPNGVVDIRNEPLDCGGGGGGLCFGGGGGGVGGDFQNVDYCTINPTDPCCTSPILIDLDGGGFKLTGANDPVRFDLNANGHPELTGWTEAGSETAFLVLDLNSDGRIDDGRELFGNYTLMPDGNRAANGYVALEVYDEPAQGGNGDGRISADDAVYPKLQLWIDYNHNGKTDPGELVSLEAAGVESIDLRYRKEKKVDRWGNAFRYRSSATLVSDRGRRRRVDTYDVFFVRVQGQ